MDVYLASLCPWFLVALMNTDHSGLALVVHGRISPRAGTDPAVQVGERRGSYFRHVL
jgi:hypothetical protein